MKTVKAKKSGTIITEELEEELAREAEAGYELTKAGRRRVGRPSLDAGVSPRVQFSATPSLHAAARRRSEAEGRRVSELAREALQRYLKASG